MIAKENFLHSNDAYRLHNDFTLKLFQIKFTKIAQNTENS